MTFVSRYRWSILSAVFGFLGYVVSYVLFPHAFSILSINLTSDRNEIVAYAQELAQNQDFLPTNFYSSVSFQTDSNAKTFIEREYGKDTFFSIIKEDIYQPYQWQVRHFVPDTIIEQSFFITPDKKPYGFSTKIPDSYISQNISEAQAAKLAIQESSYWNIDLKNYILVAPSHQTSPSGRIDHTFIYERHDQKLGEGTYRVKIVVSGNKVSTVKQYIQVPESFIKKYQEESSFNNFLAAIALFFTLFFFILIGCGFGGFYLFKNSYLIMMPPLKVGIIGGIFGFLNHINSFPLLWMHYQTSQSTASFLIMHLSIALISSLQTFGIFFFILLIAEGLTRQAFKHHPQFWLSLTSNKTSNATIEQIIIGYSSTGFLLSFVVIFYFCMTRFFGWWIPVDTLINPNMLASYIPCLSPIFAAISAGVVEESLFRAIPLAGSLLIGRFFNNERLFLTLGFIFQIFAFGAAHANYPSQPYYARLIELILPSSLFGGIYIFFGLFPGIIAHAFYDLILMGLPLFVSDAKNIIFQQIIIMIVGLIPIIITTYYRFKKETEPQPQLNCDWIKPIDTAIQADEQQATQKIDFSRRRIWICNIIGLTGFLFLILFGQIIHEKTLLKKDELITKPLLFEIPEKIAIPFITNDSRHNNQYLQYRYIWQKSPELYQELIKKGFLHMPHWAVRYTQFHGSITERTHESYLFYKGQDLYRQKIIIPENKDIPSLSEDDALKLAYKTIFNEYGISKSDLTIIEKNSHKQVARLDWNFIFEITDKAYSDISRRIIITIAGNVITDYAQYIFIPEPWIRENIRQEGILANILLIVWILIIGILLVGFYKTAQSISLNSINWKMIMIATSILSFFGICNIINNWNIHFASFVSIESLSTQIIKLLLANTLFIIIKSGLYSIALFFCLRCQQPTYLWSKKKDYTQNTGKWDTIKREWQLNNRYIFPLISAGIVPLCLLFIGKYFTFGESPFISNLYYQQAYFPSYAIAYDTLTTFISFLTILMLSNSAIALITSEWKKNYFISFLIYCIIGGLIALEIPFFTPITACTFVIYALLLGVGLTIMHHLITRYDRFTLLLMSQMLTTFAITLTVPTCYSFSVIYITIVMAFWLRSCIDY